MTAFQHRHAGLSDHDHDEHSDHFHDATGKAVWRADHVVLTTVGIDVGSSTSHFMFARLHMQRTTHALTSRFVVVERDVMWRSSILFTPYRTDGSIDAKALSDFIGAGYAEAGFAWSDIDSGAVILTGEALKRTNARAIAEIFSRDAGKLVCATAGHRMECLLGAHGSGAVRRSREREQTILNIDIGGGTTKFALIRNGLVVDAVAVAVGARLLAVNSDGVIERVESSAKRIASTLGLAVRAGDPLSPFHRDRITARMARVLIDVANRRTEDPLSDQLLLTAPWNEAARNAQIDAVSFSGGVAEYVYGRERADFGDLGRELGRAMREAVDGGALVGGLTGTGEGIRATVIGASQFSVQLSGNTVYVAHPDRLPLRNVPVVPLVLPIDAGRVSAVTAAVREAMVGADLADGAGPLGIAFTWTGQPTYDRIETLARGILTALPLQASGVAPLALLVDGDIGMSLGRLIGSEIARDCDVIAIDGLELAAFDFVDIGAPLEGSDVMPVTIKSLLF